MKYAEVASVRRFFPFVCTPYHAALYVVCSPFFLQNGLMGERVSGKDVNNIALIAQNVLFGEHIKSFDCIHKGRSVAN